MNNLYLLSNVNTDIIKQVLEKDFIVFSPYGYGAWESEIQNSESPLNKGCYENLFVCIEANDIIRKFFDKKASQKALDNCLSLIEKLLITKAESKVWISTIDLVIRRCRNCKENSFERELEFYWLNRIKTFQEQYNNAFLIDIKEGIENLGRKNFYSEKMWYAGSIPYSLKGTNYITQKLKNSIKRTQKAELKCLAVDFDGTLYGGIIGEDGVNNLLLSEHGKGEIYYNLQLQIKRLIENGIILIGLTKNNSQDINEVFSHPHMVLKRDDFVILKSDWNKKSDNLKEAVLELNIGLDSVAFLDDNPIERDLMRNEIPDVSIINFPSAIIDLEKDFIAFANKHFNKVSLTHEDFEKTKMYKEEGLRIKAKNDFVSFKDYIDSLEIIIDFHEAGANDIIRISQLFMKTNQFNLTGKRYNTIQIENEQKKGTNFFVVSVKDKYGDYGTVSAIAVSIQEKSASMLNFVMSCRVMGRTVEYKIMDILKTWLRSKGIILLNGEYIKTSKNAPVHDFLEHCGFNIKEDANNYKKGILFLIE